MCPHHSISDSLMLFFQNFYSQCIELAAQPGINKDSITQLLNSLPRVNLCTLKAIALFLHELSESSSVTLMSLDNFAIVFAPCWLRNPSDDPNSLLLNVSFEIAFTKQALTVLCNEEFVLREGNSVSSPAAATELLNLNNNRAPQILLANVERPNSLNVTPSIPKSSKIYARRKANPTNPSKSAGYIPSLYVGVALEEQCACVWFGQRIPAVLSGMLTALSTPVDVMLDALSCAAAFDDCTAAVVFAELESLCVGRAGDADVVCRAIVSKRSVHGAGLDIGLLRLWLRRLPDAVSCEYLNRCP